MESGSPHDSQTDDKKYKEQDAGHFKYYLGKIIGNYKIVSHLGDGTFGRAFKCLSLQNQTYFAVKVIRAVKRYNSSAKVEIKILKDVRDKGGCKHNIVHLEESFVHEERVKNEKTVQACLVFETLGKSLYEFIKGNKYYGFALH